MKSTYRGIAVESLTTVPVKPKSPKPGDLIQTTLAHVLVKKNISDNGSVWYEEQRQPRGSFMLCIGENKFLWNGEVVTITFQGTDWQLIKEM